MRRIAAHARPLIAPPCFGGGSERPSWVAARLPDDAFPGRDNALWEIRKTLTLETRVKLNDAFRLEH